MKLAALHPQLLGTWSGESLLWMGPDAEPLPSASRLVVAPAGMGRFLTLSYTWLYEGKPQEGLLLVGDHNNASTATAAWVDSWHQSGKVMHCVGAATDTGFAVSGSYPAPPGPDWGWRLSVRCPAADELLFEMHNVPPGGPAELAVRVAYRRTATG